MSLTKVYTATIFAEPESFQDVFYTFEYILKKKSFLEDGGDLYEVNSLEIKIPLMIQPTDIELDLQTAIRSELSLDDSDVVKIDCEIKYCSVVSETVKEIAI
jgi:hypothetical protein